MCIYWGWPVFLGDSVTSFTITCPPTCRASQMAGKCSGPDLQQDQREGWNYCFITSTTYLQMTMSLQKLGHLQMSVTYFVHCTWGFWVPFFGLLGLLQPYSPTIPLLLLRKTKMQVSSQSLGHCASKQKASIYLWFETSGLCDATSNVKQSEVNED